VTRTSADDARLRVLESRRLAKLPVLAEAVAAGRLGRAQAAEIMAPLLKTLYAADPALVETACANLVELVDVLPASAVLDAARAWATVLDPDGIEPDERRALDKRFVTLGRARNGLVKLSGLLPVEQAATIRAVLDAYANPKAGESVMFIPSPDGDPDSGHEALVVSLDEPPTDTRTPRQKRADILHLVFAAQARAGDVPTRGGAHPTLLVTISAESLESGTGPAWVDGEDEPISAKAGARIADAGGYQEAEVAPSGEILTLGRTQRCFSPAQRRALAVRDGGCVIPGCDIPARWCEAHHVRPHRDGGPTDVGNGTSSKTDRLILAAQAFRP
jgi:5-methylcytosine-specific restriction protein A